MKKYRWLIPFIVLTLVILSCEGSEDINFGIGIETCDHRCGENTTCQTSRGDMEAKKKVDISFPLGGVNQDGTRDYPENAQSVNATLTVTVEGEGSVKITVNPLNGNAITYNASNGNPAVITADFPLKFKKEKPDELNTAIETADIVGIQVETVDGPALGVQLNMAINECSDPWCNESHPNCRSD